MPDYAAIYDDVYQRVPGYQTPLSSPGLRVAYKAADLIRASGPDHLDVGCGLGFVVEALRNIPFRKNSRGADVSRVACQGANTRLGEERAFEIQAGRLPFEDQSFDLVTCFDVLEHLDLPDVERLRMEINRVAKPGALQIFNISLRDSGTRDLNNESVHRTVRPAYWWDEIFNFDRYEVDKADREMTAFVRR
ncbi:hypothetical protein BJF93_10005 [Xaviernesmea oryzae]|uniref:Methyltransferase type 11 domain-containing protein n=1 Tax=Xaviernesmea oryzae TaxID=464029 RepID=A0A1Q9AWW4_9HYPH|nr:class I SAM-dependent methyltransferase [Xaviernesmea oryzae]OLP59924.1 hypothetical protein BJF93_10005 [Xaviernesmea oryzae]SEK44868.1 Methyltransferase domain-containing protein [Xaviernesmea oryzae]